MTQLPWACFAHSPVSIHSKPEPICFSTLVFNVTTFFQSFHRPPEPASSGGSITIRGSRRDVCATQRLTYSQGASIRGGSVRNFARGRADYAKLQVCRNTRTRSDILGSIVPGGTEGQKKPNAVKKETSRRSAFRRAARRGLRNHLRIPNRLISSR